MTPCTLLKQLAEVSRNDDGGVGFEVLQQRSRQNHFTIVEIWQNQQTFEAHAMAAHTRQFREQFQPLSGSLYDERLYQALGAVGGPDRSWGSWRCTAFSGTYPHAVARRAPRLWG